MSLVEDPVFYGLTFQDVEKLVRFLSTQTPRVISWRENRSYMVVDQAQIDAESSDVGSMVRDF